MIEVEVVETETQIDAVARLANRIFPEVFYEIPQIGKPLTDYLLETMQSSAAIGRQIKEQDYRYYLISYAGALAGYFAFSDRQDILFMSKAYLLAQFRGKGIFHYMLDNAVKRARQNGMRAIQLCVNKYNTAAKAAYEAYGFSVIADEVTDAGHGFFLDDYRMEFPLSR